MKLPWTHQPTARAKKPALPAWVTANDQVKAAEDTASVQGCGWFDSSHELSCGLHVTEHQSPDRVANEVPLGWWLDWQLTPGAMSTPQGLSLR